MLNTYSIVDLENTRKLNMFEIFELCSQASLKELQFGVKFDYKSSWSIITWLNSDLVTFLISEVQTSCAQV